MTSISTRRRALLSLSLPLARLTPLLHHVSSWRYMYAYGAAWRGVINHGSRRRTLHSPPTTVRALTALLRATPHRGTLEIGPHVLDSIMPAIPPSRLSLSLLLSRARFSSFVPSFPFSIKPTLFFGSTCQPPRRRYLGCRCCSNLLSLSLFPSIHTPPHPSPFLSLSRLYCSFRSTPQTWNDLVEIAGSELYRGVYTGGRDAIMFYGPRNCMGRPREIIRNLFPATESRGKGGG